MRIAVDRLLPNPRSRPRAGPTVDRWGHSSLLTGERGRQTIGTLVFLGAFTVYWAAGLVLDQYVDLRGQLALGVITWALLFAALGRSNGATWRLVFCQIAVACLFEVLGSQIWRLYDYRLHNLPLFVPPGHGLFYLAAVRAAALPTLIRYARPITYLTYALATGYSFACLFLPPAPDWLGLIAWAVFTRFIWWGRAPLLYAVSFLLTMTLEFYGTFVGTWTWAPVIAGLGMTVGNPPSAVGAAYCVVDGLARRLFLLTGRLPWWMPKVGRAQSADATG
jgi:hypothetical protein